MMQENLQKRKMVDSTTTEKAFNLVDSQMTWIKQNSLIFGILLAVLLGWLTPEYGASHGHLHSQTIVKIGIILIFLSQGFSLSTKEMVSGFKYWKMHLFVQFWIYLGVPAIAMIQLKLAGNHLPDGLKLGLFFLSVLPTTVSSAVALVSYGKGNTAGAIFNTVFSNLSAVLMIPIWLLWYQNSLESIEISFWPAFIKLAKLLLIPFFIGHLSRPILHKWEQSIKRQSKPLNQGIITFIVYAAFATSFRDKVWENVGADIALTGFICGLALLLTVSVFVLLSCRLFFSNPTDRIASFFTASQKSLATGIPFSVAFFSMLSSSTDPSLKQSVVILPLLFYHPFQLLLASIMLRYKAVLFGEKTTQ